MDTDDYHSSMPAVRALQALVQLLAQTRDNLQYPWDNIIVLHACGNDS